MEIVLDINIKSLEYFRVFFKIKYPLDCVYKDSVILKNTVNDLISNNKNFLEDLFKSMFPKIKLQILKVEIFPDYFKLWAVNLKDNVILLWQKNRSVSFYLWLLWHEITHIYLWKYNSKSIVNETMCFLVEYYIYEHLEWKNIYDIWRPKDLDKFHEVAAEYSYKSYKNFKEVVDKNKDIITFLKYLESIIDEKYLNILPNIGLIANIKLDE